MGGSGTTYEGAFVPVRPPPEPYLEIQRRVYWDDADYFDAHPSEPAYVRRRVPGEFYPDELPWEPVEWVLVLRGGGGQGEGPGRMRVALREGSPRVADGHADYQWQLTAGRPNNG